jgi:hypothetical protein
MIRIPFESNTLLIGAIVVLVGAPTAGATMMLGSRQAAPPLFEQGASESAPGSQGLKVELVAPKEPEVAAAYPLDTFATPPVDEFKGRAPHGRAWRVSFGLDIPPPQMMAEPAGAYGSMPAEEAEQEQARFERAREDYMRAEAARDAVRFAEEARAEREGAAYQDRIFRPALAALPTSAEVEPLR